MRQQYRLKVFCDLHWRLCLGEVEQLLPPITASKRGVTCDPTTVASKSAPFEIKSSITSVLFWRAAHEEGSLNGIASVDIGAAVDEFNSLGSFAIFDQ